MAEEPVELGYYGAVIRRHWGLVAVISVLTGLVAAATFGSSRYVATADVLVQPIATVGSTGEVQPDRAINTNTERAIARSPAVAALVADEIGADDARSLLSHLSVTVPPESQILSFEFSAKTGDRARAAAQAFAEAYLRFRADYAEAARAERIAQLREQLELQTAELVDANLIINRANDSNDDNNPTSLELAQAQARRELLLDEVSVINDDLGEWRELQITPGRVIAPAVEPSAPSRQSRFVLLAVGLVLGAVLGAAAAFVLDRIRARVNTPDDLADELGAPVLAAIPPVARASQTLVTLTDPHAPAAHAYRRLANALTADPDRQTRWAMLVGATDAEPRADVAINLAVALIQQGRQVLLVSADRHDPQIDRCFDLAGVAGYDQHLAGVVTTEPREVFRGLYVLPAGTGEAFPVQHVPPQQAVASVLERGRRIADVVLVDAPPALDYPDAEAIGPLVDAVIVVASAEKTSRRQVSELRARLDLVMAPVRGAVLVHRPSLRHHLAVMLRERAEGRRGAAAGVVPAETTTVTPLDRGWADDSPASAALRSSEDRAQDAAALRARIESLLRRHTPTGLSPRLSNIAEADVPPVREREPEPAPEPTAGRPSNS